MQTTMWTALAVFLIATGAGAQLPATDPGYSVDEADLASAVVCSLQAEAPASEPVLLVHGTGSTPEESWHGTWLPVLLRLGFDVCTVRLPNRSLGDIQVSAEYVVYAIRHAAALTGKRVDVIGHSQGALSPRWAIRWWPEVRDDLVDDYVGLAGPHHGASGTETFCSFGQCAASLQQMRTGSSFLERLNSVDETPGSAISFTSLYSLTDEQVQPAFPEPTARIEGASNVLLQEVCPGRPAGHVTLVTDAAAFAIVLDALTGPGPADPRRLPGDVCLGAFAPGMDPVLVVDANVRSYALAIQAVSTAEQVSGEPPPAPYVQ